MKQDMGIRLQAYLDGELSDREREEFREVLARDPELQALQAELEWVKPLLREADPVSAVPGSPDFYFSQIRKRIEASEPAAATPAPALSPVEWFRRALLPLGGVAIAGFLMMTSFRTGVGPVIGSLHEETEALLEETSAMTFRSESEGVTVVWLYDKELPSGSVISDDE